MNHLVVNALKKALEEQPSHGICGVLQTLYANMPTSFDTHNKFLYSQLVIECCMSLDLFSGQRLFPLKAGVKEPCILYRDAKSRGLLWSKRHKYGRARRAVAKLMIKELEDADNAVNNNSSTSNTSD